jgi:arylsulfatase A-like enzyme
VREWGALTLVAALAATVVDGYLLDRKIGLFTGGFLADVYLLTLAEQVGFLALSVLVDAGVLGLIVALVLWTCARLRVRPAGRVLFSLGFALLPVAWFDFVSYQLHHYIGDIFNLGVLFDLSGRSVGEFLAVAGPQILALFALLAAGIAAIFATAWVLNRFIPLLEGDDYLRWSRGRRVATLALALFVVSLVVGTVARLQHEATDRGMMRKASGAFQGTIVQFTTDVDRDGYGLLSRPADPDPFDATIHPYAIDIPGNGIDENGVAGDLPSGLPPYVEGGATAPSWTVRPKVFVFVILETFRADLLHDRLDGREITPVLNRLAAAGASAGSAFSHNGYTIQSRFHLFTGSLANLRGGTSLIDDFNAEGYETAFLSAQDESFGDWMDVGFKRADVRYDARDDAARRLGTFSTPGSLTVSSTVLLERLEEFLAGRDHERPLFLHLNFQDLHYPYWHAGLETMFPHEVIGAGRMRAHRAAALKRMYANTAANVDRDLGRALELVRERTGVEPAVLVTADHGESLFDDGLLGHGLSATSIQTRIPLIAVNLPVEFVEPFAQIDLRDTLWRALGGEVAGARVVQDPDKRVFQYVGVIETPREISWFSVDRRITYNFHADEINVNKEGWVAFERAEEAVRAEAVELIRFWERVRLAQATARR